MFRCTRHTSLRFPAFENITVKVLGFAIGPVVTHVDPSNVAGLVENPGHPTGNGGRTCPAFRKVIVWSSSVTNFHVMSSPALIHISLGSKAIACMAFSVLC